MAVKLIANYAKRLGLPGYSSHQFSVSVETELRDVEDVAGESERLYKLLQQSVDQQMQETGFVPPNEYGMDNGNGHPSNGNGHSPRHNGNGHQRNGNGYSSPHRNTETWNCTEGQKGLILRIVNESKMPKEEVEEMAQQLFGIGVKQLDKMQASQIIEELLEKTGKKVRRSNWNGRQTTPAR